MGGHFHMSLGDFLLAMVLAGLVLNPISILAHELGHAFFALRYSEDKVIVVVGRQTAAVGISFERLTIWWSPIPTRGVTFAGLCIWNGRRAPAQGHFRVSLAGPVVTALLIPVYIYLAALTLDWSSKLVPATLAFEALNCLAICLFILDPRETKEEKEGRRRRRDGPKAFAAYRAMRAARSVET
jgi:hypothetical protein